MAPEPGDILIPPRLRARLGNSIPAKHGRRRKVDGFVSAVLCELGDGASLSDEARCAGLLGGVTADLAPVGYDPTDERYEAVMEHVEAIFDPIAGITMNGEWLRGALRLSGARDREHGIILCTLVRNFNMSTQKELERFELEAFLQVTGIPAKDIEEGESPDFVMTVGDKRVGLEHTGFHSRLMGKDGRPRRAVEEGWRRLQDLIRQEAETRPELKGGLGHLYFRELEVPTPRENSQFVEELLDMAVKMVLSGSIDEKPREEYPLLTRYLKRMTVQKLEGCDVHLMWEWNHMVSFIGISEDELVDAVGPKIEKAATYDTESTDELWLLVISGPRLSQAVPGHNLKEKPKSYAVLDKMLSESTYAQCFIYLYMEEAVFRWPSWDKVA